VKFPDPTIPGFALALWALAVVFWTPYILLRTDLRRPRADSARAAALLAFGLLAWPLGALVALLAVLAGLDSGAALYLAFPVVFAGGAGAMILAARTPAPPAVAPAGRGRLLGGGALIYAACTAALVAIIAGPLFRAVRDPAQERLVALAIVILAVLAVLTGLGAVRLAGSALRAWRARPSAAAP
jgi:hypothetical protein